MAEQSTASETLWLLDSLADFQGYSLELVKQTNRHIAILSHQLDDLVYGTEDFVQALSNFARSSRHCEVRLLIKDTKPAPADKARTATALQNSYSPHDPGASQQSHGVYARRYQQAALQK